MVRQRTGRAANSSGTGITRQRSVSGDPVVNLVFGQHGAQMLLAEDQHAVEKLAAQRADEAFASRVHPRSLHGGPQDPGAVCLEDGVDGPGEIRSAVANEELELLEPFAEAEGEVSGLLHGPLAGGVRGDAAEMYPAGAVLDEHQDVPPLQPDGACVQGNRRR